LITSIKSERVQSFVKSKNFDVIINTATYGSNRLLQDDYSWVYYNCLMLYNFFEVKDYYGKLIHFGSGAELDRSRDINESSDIDNLFPKDPYGMSKNIIYHLTKNSNNFYNLRIFAVFNENELNTRFIKSNILRYKKRESIEIHKNKFMDFFYMDDLFNLVQYVIDNNCEEKEFNCCYNHKLYLSDIAEGINNLDKHKVPIIIEKSQNANSYYGKFNIPSSIKLIGFENGLKNTYTKLKESL